MAVFVVLVTLLLLPQTAALPQCRLPMAVCLALCILLLNLSLICIWDLTWWGAGWGGGLDGVGGCREFDIKLMEIFLVGMLAPISRHRILLLLYGWIGKILNVVYCCQASYKIRHNTVLQVSTENT